MKKSFTLIEMLISIILFSIILLFLYEVLASTTNHNKIFTKNIDKIINKSDLQMLVLEDFLNQKSNSTIKIIEDKNQNNILTFQTNNTYHNPFFSHVTYLINGENTLVRIESKKEFKKDTLYQILETSNIDILFKNIKKFKIKKSKIGLTYLFFIETEDSQKILFPLRP